MTKPSALFKSFWLAGFEGADHVNGAGLALSMNAITQHDRRVVSDYELLGQVAIKAARESVGWRLAEVEPGRFDFSFVAERARAAQEAGIQVLWTLCHFGFPAHVDILAADFSDRFADYAAAAVRFLKPYSDTPGVYTPLNEISFLTWALCESRMMGYRGEALHGRCVEIKRQLVRAALAACDAIWSIDSRARIVHTDPLIHVIAPPEQPELAADAQRYRESQFESWDMLCGKAAPELGGHPRYLDILGVNFYHSNQFEYGTGRPLLWHLHDPRRIKFRQILAETYRRYQRPLFVAETSHVGVGRGEWISEITQEIAAALEQGIPVGGICLYPIIDRPDWSDLDHWHNSGLWDLVQNDQGELEPVVNAPYLTALCAAQQTLNALADSSQPLLYKE